MIPEYKLITTVPTLQYGYMSVDKWIAMFPHLSQDDFNNPRLFTSNLESMVEPKKKEQEWEIVAVRDEGGRLWYTDMKQKMNEKIDTVKRLSDGQTFSVSGDYYYGSEYNRKGKILKFKLLPDNEMVVEIYPDGETNSTGSIFRNLDELSQQPPQEEQKDNNVFVWTDKDIVDFCNYVAKPRVRWGTGIMEEEIKKINKLRQERLDLCEVIYNTPTSPNYRDNERYSWAVKKINENFDERIKALEKV